MPRPPSSHLTTLLAELRQGDVHARDELVTLVYPELRRIAARYFREERSGHTLRPTALVHEAYLRLFGAEQTDWQNRAHFFAAVAREMRHVLVDYARARNAKKRAAPNLRISLSDINLAADARGEDLLALDQALVKLEGIDARASQIVELRYFTGLTEEEAAAVLNISISTLKRDWKFAKAWLFDQLSAASAD